MILLLSTLCDAIRRTNNNENNLFRATTFLRAESIWRRPISRIIIAGNVWIEFVGSTYPSLQAAICVNKYYKIIIITNFFLQRDAMLRVRIYIYTHTRDV